MDGKWWRQSGIQFCYGKITVEKRDCVGHIQKRMGKHLLNLKARTKGRLADGQLIGGHGWLMEGTIKQLQKYCGLVIHQNTIKRSNPTGREVDVAVLSTRPSQTTSFLSSMRVVVVQVAAGCSNWYFNRQRLWLPTRGLSWSPSPYIYDIKWCKTTGEVRARDNTKSKWVCGLYGVGPVPQIQAPLCQTGSVCSGISSLSLPQWSKQQTKNYGETFNPWWSINKIGI